MKYGWDALQSVCLGGQAWAKMKLGKVKDRSQPNSFTLRSLTLAGGDKRPQKGVRKGVCEIGDASERSLR